MKGKVPAIFLAVVILAGAGTIYFFKPEENRSQAVGPPVSRPPKTPPPAAASQSPASPLPGQVAQPTAEAVTQVPTPTPARTDTAPAPAPPAPAVTVTPRTPAPRGQPAVAAQQAAASTAVAPPIFPLTDRAMVEQVNNFISAKTGVAGIANELLYEPDPDRPGRQRLRGDITRIVLRDQRTDVSPQQRYSGQIYYFPAEQKFYVNWTPTIASSNRWYGPFEGDPYEVLLSPRTEAKPGSMAAGAP